MKKKISALIVSVLFSAVLISCEKAPSTTTLTYSIFFPPSHGQCQAGTEWAQEIEKRSDGRIKINVFPGGTLTSANECYDGVVKGISDIGMSCFAYTRGRFPIMEAVDLPMGYLNGKVATYTANAFYQAMKPKELDDVKVLYLHAHGPGLLHTTKPIKSLGDLKGMKIRSTGLSTKIVSALGATPVAMSQGETYEALQKGVAEGTFAPFETLKGWRQGEVIKYTTDCSAIGYTTTMFVVMNRSKWDALPKDLQAVFETVSTEWIKVHADTWDQLDVEGREYSLGLQNKIIRLDSDSENEWTQAVEPIIDDYARDTNQKGLPGDQAIAKLRELTETYRKQYPD